MVKIKLMKQNQNQKVNIIINNNTERKKRKYTKRKKNNEILPQNNQPQIAYNPNLLPYNRTPSYGLKSINPVLNNESIISNILNNKFNNYDNINYDRFSNPTITTQTAPTATPTPITVSPIGSIGPPITIPSTIPLKINPNAPIPPPPPPPGFFIKPPPITTTRTPITTATTPVKGNPFVNELTNVLKKKKKEKEEKEERDQMILQHQQSQQQDPSVPYVNLAFQPQTTSAASTAATLPNINTFDIPDPNKLNEAAKGKGQPEIKVKDLKSKLQLTNKITSLTNKLKQDLPTDKNNFYKSELLLAKDRLIKGDYD